jgi:DNA-binding transcriptional LysR family regulator
MLDLNQLAVFIRVVEEGSFTAAGKALGMPKSRVSRMVADLETQLGVRLLHRTTRRLHLTEVGQGYYEHCRQSISDIHSAHSMLADREQDAHGLLRIAVPMVAGSGALGHYLARFQQQYPEVRLEVLHTEGQINLVEEGFDVGVYFGPMPDSSLVARTITTSDNVLVASPEYLARVGKPEHPRDLANMRCVKIGEGTAAVTYELHHANSQENCQVQVEPNIVINMVASAVNSIVHGAGVGAVPFLLAGEFIVSGQLVPIFQEWELKPQAISLAYPTRQYLPQKVRKFIDFMLAEAERLETMLQQLPDPEQQWQAFAHLVKGL